MGNFSGMLSSSSPGVGDIVAYLGIGGYEDFKKGMDQADKTAQQKSQQIQKAMNTAAVVGAAAFATIVMAGVKFESSFTGVTKTVDGLRDDFGNLNSEGLALAEGFRELAFEIPESVHELNKIGELGGQLGIAKSDLLLFTETIAKLGVTTNLTTEQAASDFARFVNITKQVAPAGMSASEQIERIGSTVVDLGNNFATTESEVVAFAMRIAGAGAQIGLSQGEILGFSAALSSVGLNAEAGGTAISKLMIKIANAVSTGNGDLEKFADIAGLTSESFANLFSQDSSEAITKFISGLGDVKEEGGNVFGVLEDLGMSEIRLRDSLLRASSASDLFSDALSKGSEAYEENNALTKEAEQRFGTLASQAKISLNIITDAFIGMGNSTNPVLSNLLGNLNEHPEAIQSVVTTLGTLAVGLGATATAAKGLIAVQKLWATSLGPVGIALTVITAAITASISLYEGHRAAILKEIDATSDEVESVEKLKNRYAELAEKKTLTKKETEEFISTGGELRKMLDEAGVDMTEYGGDILKAAAAYRELRKEQIELKMDELAGKIGETSGAFAGLGAAIGGDLGDLISKLGGGRVDDLGQEYAALKKELEELSGTTEKQTEIQETLNIATDAGVISTNALSAAEDARSDLLAKLKDLGIETTDQIRSQIDEHTALIPLVKDDAFAHGQLLDKIIDLNLKLGDNQAALDAVTKSYGNIKISLPDVPLGGIRTSFEELKPVLESGESLMTGFVSKYAMLEKITADLEDPRKKEIEQLESALNLYDLTNEETELVKEKLENLRDETGDGSKSWADYASYLDEIIDGFNIGGKNAGLMKEGISMITNIATDSFDPVSLGLKAINMGLNLFKDKNEEVSRSLGDVKEMLGTTNESFEDSVSILEDMNGAFSSKIIGQYQDQLNAVMEDMQTATGSTLANLYLLAEEYSQQLRDLTSSFVLSENLQSEIASLDVLIEKASEMSDYFGGMDTTGLQYLLEGEIAAAQKLMDSLDPASQAYADLAEKIRQAGAALLELSGQTDNINYTPYAEQIAALSESIGSYQEEIDALEDSLNDASNGEEYAAILAQMDALNEKREAAIVRLAELKQSQENYNDSINGEAESHARAAERREDHNRELAAMSDYEAYIAELIAKETEELEKQQRMQQRAAERRGEHNKELAAMINYEEYLKKIAEDSAAEEKRLEMLKKRQERQAELNLEMSAMIEYEEYISGLQSQVAESFDDTTKSIKALVIAWGDMTKAVFDEFSQFEKDIITASSAIEQLLYFNVDLSTTDADEQIAASIQSMREYLTTLSPDSQAYQDAKERLDELNELWQKLQDTQSGALAIKSELNDVKLALDGLYEKREVIELEAQIKIEDLQGQIRDQLKTIDDLELEKIAIDAQLGIDIDKTRVKIAEQHEIIDNLFAEIGMVDIQLGVDISNIESQKAELGRQLEDIQTNYIQKDRSIKIDIDSTMDNITFLKSVIDGLDDGVSDFDFTEITNFIETATGGAATLQLTWDSMMSSLMGEHSEFETQLKQANDAVEQLLFFNVDLDTTNVDEQINAMIQQMKNYLADLNPDSEAFTEVQTALDDLVASFTAAGGEIDENAAIDLVANTGVNELQTQLDALFLQMQENDMQFKIDTNDALTKINDLDRKIDELIESANIEKASINVEISKAIETIGLLKKDIDGFVESAELEKAKINLEISEAQTNIGLLLTELKSTYSWLDETKYELDLDISEALKKIADLENQLDNLFKDPNISGVDPIKGDENQSQAYHSGGLLTAHTGRSLLPREKMFVGLEDEFVLRPAATQKFSEQQLNAFNASLDPNVLNSQPQAANVNVHVHNAGPNTWVEVVENDIYSNVKKLERHFEIGSNPYK